MLCFIHCRECIVTCPYTWCGRHRGFSGAASLVHSRHCQGVLPPPSCRTQRVGQAEILLARVDERSDRADEARSNFVVVQEQSGVAPASGEGAASVVPPPLPPEPASFTQEPCTTPASYAWCSVLTIAAWRGHGRPTLEYNLQRLSQVYTAGNNTGYDIIREGAATYGYIVVWT